MTHYFKINDFGRQKVDFGIGKLLYDGGDHLLVAENLGAREDYVRVYFKDIRFFAVFPKRKPYIKYIIAAGLLLAVLVRELMAFGFNGVFEVIAVEVIPVILLVRNFPKSNCVCRIGTDFQQITLPVPTEMKYVESFAEYLKSRAVPF